MGDATDDASQQQSKLALYTHHGCPWAHRANILRSLKGLEDVIQLVVMDYILGPEGWTYNSDRPGENVSDIIPGLIS